MPAFAQLPSWNISRCWIRIAVVHDLLFRVLSKFILGPELAEISFP